MKQSGREISKRRITRVVIRLFSRALPTALLLMLPLFAAAASPNDPSSLSIEESVRKALLLSPKARAARLQLDAEHAKNERERPVSRPTLQASLSGTLQTPSRALPGIPGPDTEVLRRESGALSLLLEQPLYQAGLGTARKRYQALETASELELRISLSELALSVRRACIDICRAEAGITAAREGLSQAQDFQKLVDKQIEAGIARPVDAAGARTQVAEAESGVRRAENGLELARWNFNRLLGLPLQSPVGHIDPGPIPVIDENPDRLLERMRAHRPELLLIESNRNSAQAGAVLAKLQNLPTLHFRGQFAQQTPTALVPSNYAAATLELRWSILDAGKSRSEAREATAQTGRLNALLEEAKQGYELETLQALQKLREARDRQELARKKLEAGKEQLVVAEKAYALGRSTLPELQAARQEQRTNAGKAQNALYDLYIAVYELQQACGDSLPEPVQPIKTAAKGSQ